MTTTTSPLPVVLCFSGNDPTGGAGIAADIESLASLGCRCAPVITVLTVQDTTNVIEFEVVDPDLVRAQAEVILRDMPVVAIKVGMIANPALVNTIADICRQHPTLPLIVDPILAAGGGTNFVDDPFILTLKRELLPLATLITPNAAEARRLCPEATSIDAAAEELLDLGCEHVLITGADEPTAVVKNTLYSVEFETETFHWERLPAMYHGSGCTLAACCAGLIAQGLNVFEAVNEAQEFTFNALKDGFAIGKGQWLPNRMFWAQSREIEGVDDETVDKVLPDDSDESEE